jgi:hypothetical protein
MCDTSALTLKEKHRLNVFENEVLRKISGPKRKGSERMMERIT